MNRERLLGSDLEKNLIAQAPLGRTRLVGDIAPIAVFLASDDSGWLTGEQLLATGGIRNTRGYSFSASFLRCAEWATRTGVSF